MPDTMPRAETNSRPTPILGTNIDPSPPANVSAVAGEKRVIDEELALFTPPDSMRPHEKEIFKLLSGFFKAEPSAFPKANVIASVNLIAALELTDPTLLQDVQNIITELGTLSTALAHGAAKAAIKYLKAADTKATYASEYISFV